MSGDILNQLVAKEKSILPLKKLYDDVELPEYKTPYSNGFDLVAHNFPDGKDHAIIYSGECVMIGIGFASAIPIDFAGLIVPRSGLASKKGLRPANTPGLIDSDYRGEIKVCLRNDSSCEQVVKKGERIAQMVIVYAPQFTLRFVDDLGETKRGDGGFGSTGIK